MGYEFLTRRSGVREDRMNRMGLVTPFERLELFKLFKLRFFYCLLLSVLNIPLRLTPDRISLSEYVPCPLSPVSCLLSTAYSFLCVLCGENEFFATLAKNSDRINISFKRLNGLTGLNVLDAIFSVPVCVRPRLIVFLGASLWPGAIARDKKKIISRIEHNGLRQDVMDKKRPAGFIPPAFTSS